MNESVIQPEVRATPSHRLIGTLGLIALLSGLLVVSVFEFTRPYIEKNHRVALERAVFEVIPGAVARREFVLTERGVEPAAPGIAGIVFHAGYDAAGGLRGVAAVAAGRGYADVIRVLYGYDPDCACIVGMKVLESKETPGLGDKIITDARFRANFERLDARLNAAGDGLANAIVTVRQGNRHEAWEIDGISGATISSVAIGRMLNAGAHDLLPRLRPHLDAIRNVE
ncbi:MAG: FMN-binding protein [Chromatiales bacterium]|jgi:electron transport complex protein RnfG|nr:FMN-binding protein [Chromatiales bacterium]MDX9766077.1 FMN-binding protein [Ectothiorhodospiraceae bacterium]